MIKRVKQIMGIVLASTMVVSGNAVVPNICAYAEEENANVQSGTYGTNITWTLENETLTISGTGKLTKIDGIDFPWAESDDIKILNVSNGITDIGDKAFYNMRNLQVVNLPNGLKNIGYWAFTNSDIRRLRIPDSVENIGENAFSCNNNCKKIVLSSNLKSVGVDAFSASNSGCIYLTGNAPKINDENWGEAPGVFSGSTIIYPKGNKTYTESFKNRFANSNVNWIEEDINDMSLELEEGDAKVQSVSLDVQGKTVESNEDDKGAFKISIKALDYAGSSGMFMNVYVYLRSERDDSEIRLMARYDKETDTYILDESNIYPHVAYYDDNINYNWAILSGKVWIEKIRIESKSGYTKPHGDNGYESIPISSYGVVSNGSDPYVAEKPEDAKYWFNVHRTHKMSFYEINMAAKSRDEIDNNTKTIFVDGNVTALGMNDIYKPKEIEGMNFKRWVCPYFNTVPDDEKYDCSCILYPIYDKEIIVFDVLFEDGNDEIVDIRKSDSSEISEEDFPVIEGYENYSWDNDYADGVHYYFLRVKGNKPDTPLKIKNSSTLSKDKITAAVDAITKAAEKTPVMVEMDNATIISKEILNAARDKDVDVTFNTTNANWTINGKSISSKDIEDTSIKLTRESGSVKEPSLSNAVGKRTVETLAFENKKAFGFDADVKLAVNSDIKNNKAVFIQKKDSDYTYKSSSVIKDNSFSLDINNGDDGYIVYGDNGDLNNNGKIDLKDAMTNLNHVSGREKLDCISEGFADVNYDGKVNIQDLIKEIYVVSGRNSTL